MQQPAKTSSPTVGQGLLYGLILGVILVIFSIVSALSTALGTILSILGFIVFIAGAAFVGYRVSAKTGKTGSGALAGMLAGIVTGVITSIYTFVYSILNMNTLIAAAQKAAQATGANIHYTPSLILLGVGFAAIFFILLYLVIGVIVGAIAGLVGKGRAPQMTAAYTEALYQGLPPTTPQTPAP